MTQNHSGSAERNGREKEASLLDFRRAIGGTICIYVLWGSGGDGMILAMVTIGVDRVGEKRMQ